MELERGDRYGFNGKENDNEVKGEGNQLDYGFRTYDPRVGKFLSVDPLTKSYPELTPYQFASNRPIDGIDQDGLEYAPPMKFDKKTEKATVDAEGAIALHTAKEHLYTIVAAVDVYLTRGKIAQIVMGQLASIFEHNRAKTPEAIQEQKARENEAALYVALTWGLSRISREAVKNLPKEPIKTETPLFVKGPNYTNHGSEYVNEGLSIAEQVSEARDILSKALRGQGLSQVPNGFKEEWTEGSYDYSVRIHGAQSNAPSGSNSVRETTFRVARRLRIPNATSTTQGNGWEYADDKGNWYPQRVLKSGGNGEAANFTHIPLNY